MMLYPAMSDLLKEVNGRYLLVNLTARRAREISEYAEEQEIELKEEDEDDFIPELKEEFYHADDSEIEAEGFTIEDVPEDELGADFGADYEEEDM